MKILTTALISVVLAAATLTAISVPTLRMYAYDTPSDWLSGWPYRKAHNITGSTAGEQINYPMMINVHYDHGVDSDGEVYLDGKCRADFGDIRFTDSTGDNFDYWMQQKVDSDQALFWVEIKHIPESPNWITFYIYYGNLNATTSSNKDWTFSLATPFEDGTEQGWSISWLTYVTWDGVSTYAYEGNYSRGAGRAYGTSNAGNGNFHEYFRKTVYLSPGSYLVEGAGAFASQDSYKTPIAMKLWANGVAIASVTSPGTQWHWLSGNFTLSSGGRIIIDMEFHLLTQGLSNGSESYYVDSIFVRKWCDPEPVHGTWGTEEALERASSTISIFASMTTASLGENITISGFITPIREGAKVNIWHRLLGDETWSSLTNVTTDENSQYSHIWMVSETGTYEVKASWMGDERTLPAESSIITIIVLQTPPPVIRKLSMKLTGEHDYLFMENVKIRLAALVKDAATMEPVSNATVTLEIYDATGTLWVSDMMVERLTGTGIYEWESEETILHLRLKKGVYLAYITASSQGSIVASDILQFHIDPPAEESSILAIYYYVITIATVLVGVVGLILLRRHVYSRFRRVAQ